MNIETKSNEVGFAEDTSHVVWGPELMVEVDLSAPDDFLKIAETLTRIGVASKTEKKLWQSCHILHKKGRYYIVHFKEMFALDGRSFTIPAVDLARRNTIATLLEDWGLLTIISSGDIVRKTVPVNSIKILPFREKGSWELISKYKIGHVKTSRGNNTNDE